MKKYHLLTLLIALLPSLSACRDPLHCITAINTMGLEHGIVEITKQQMLNLLESKQQFVLEQYTSSCAHCKALRPLLEKYTKSKKKVIYAWNCDAITEEDWYETLSIPYPELFAGAYIPRVQFISNGELTYEVSSAKFESYNALSNMLDKHFNSSKITMVNTEADLEAYTKANDSYIAYSYDIEFDKSLSLANQYLITDEVAKAKKPVLLINYVAFTGSLSILLDKYNVDYASFAVLVKDGEIKRAIDYSQDDGSELNAMVFSF